jgi:hypothetical protein
MVALINFETPMKVLSISCVTKIQNYRANNNAEIGKLLTIGSAEYPVYKTKKSKEFGVYTVYINMHGVLFDCGNALNCN